MKASEFNGDLNQFLAQYGYQPELTKKLDSLKTVPFSQEIVNEIVLWKVNRYVLTDSHLLEGLRRLMVLRPKEHRKAADILTSLLNKRGVDLPMASTLMRFRNNRVFQIIDRHAYRAITGEKYPLYPSRPHQQKVSVYFAYLDEVIALCEKRSLLFETVDRLLYIFDKRTNGKL